MVGGKRVERRVKYKKRGVTKKELDGRAGRYKDRSSASTNGRLLDSAVISQNRTSRMGKGYTKGTSLV